MAGYLFKRAAASLIVIFAVITLTFVIMHAIPGSPFAGEKNLPPAVRKNITRKYALDQPVWRQYKTYISNLAVGDLGSSLRYGRRVNSIIGESFPVSAALGLAAVSLSLLIGIPAGIIAALRANKRADRAVTLLATAGLSIPNFVTASLLIYIFSVKLKLLPASFWGTPRHFILPVLSLTLLPASVIMRLTRSGVLEVLQQEYIVAARARGLSNCRILTKHVLRNAISPLVSYLGPLIAEILMGSFVIEHIFAIPGLGRYFVNSVFNRDYTLIMGLVVFYTTLLVIMNLVVDLAYSLTDPRIRLRSWRYEAAK